MFTSARIVVLKSGYCLSRNCYRVKGNNSRPRLLPGLAVEFRARIMYSKKKVEHKPENGIVMPPIWCSPICKNSMSEGCIEVCAPSRDCSFFKLKIGLNLEDMPRFPLKETDEMTREEKFTSVAVYISKITDHLKGVDDGREPGAFTYRKRGFKISSDVEVSGLHDDSKEGTAVYQSEPASDSGKRERPSEMATETEINRT